MASSQSQQVGSDVCVIGTGVLGLLALKNLLEQGLNATAFERNEYIGGTWHASLNPGQTTALTGTTLNTSRHCCSFTDFPIPYDYPVHPPQKDLEKYIESYAKNFNLLPHIEFSTSVDHVERDQERGVWEVFTKNTKSGVQECRTFSRVVVATGMLNAKNIPNVKGINKFEGDILHSRQFKDASKYKDKNVLVVGIGATGADTTSFLVKAGASKVYLSHRGQFYLLPRRVKGKAFDHSMSRRVGICVRALGSLWPRAFAALMSKGLISQRNKAFPFLSEHSSFASSRPIDGILHRIPIFSDDLADNLRDGRVKSVLGIQEVTGPKSVTLTDGTVLDDLDAIIFCSGYHYDFSVVRGPGDPTDSAIAPDHNKKIEATQHYSDDNKFARLYHGFLSEQYPDSLAFLGHVIIMKPPFVLYDLISMALAGVWSGSYPIESAEERRRDIDAHYNFMVKTLDIGPVPHLGLRLASAPTYEWLNQAAGTGVTENLGCFSWQAWKLWWNDRKFYNLLMDGVDVPAVYRLFDTGRGRKPWPGARAAIEEVNQQAKELGEEWERENQDKKTK
ncbi:hypothetical protein CEP51_001371 [Fusarium floridanum]|uniref:Uncharacterized protein n=1 Tax=Fusarium floridanum TaxID=1325733 RepID=A0A428SHC6_9HYPO|nr:hypothetical protein CEP51_001371 [Fusarium floridanum]